MVCGGGEAGRGEGRIGGGEGFFFFFFSFREGGMPLPLVDEDN